MSESTSNWAAHTNRPLAHDHGGGTTSPPQSGLNTPSLRSGARTPDPLLSALRSANGSFLSSAQQTPGSMTPRTRQRYDLKRAALIQDLESHDQKMESRALDRRLRHELFMDKLRKDEERFERIRARRLLADSERRKREEQEFANREREVENVRIASRTSSAAALSPQASLESLSASNTSLARSMERLDQNGPRGSVTGEAKASVQAANDLQSFQNERRLKKLARQKAEEERKRLQSVVRKRAEESIENEFGEAGEDNGDVGRLSVGVRAESTTVSDAGKVISKEGVRAGEDRGTPTGRVQDRRDVGREKDSQELKRENIKRDYPEQTEVRRYQRGEVNRDMTRESFDSERRDRGATIGLVTKPEEVQRHTPHEDTPSKRREVDSVGHKESRHAVDNIRRNQVREDADSLRRERTDIRPATDRGGLQPIHRNNDESARDDVKPSQQRTSDQLADVGLREEELDAKYSRSNNRDIQEDADVHREEGKSLSIEEKREESGREAAAVAVVEVVQIETALCEVLTDEAVRSTSKPIDVQSEDAGVALPPDLDTADNAPTFSDANNLEGAPDELSSEFASVPTRNQRDVEEAVQVGDKDEQFSGRSVDEDILGVQNPEADRQRAKTGSGLYDEQSEEAAVAVAEPSAIERTSGGENISTPKDADYSNVPTSLVIESVAETVQITGDNKDAPVPISLSNENDNSLDAAVKDSETGTQEAKKEEVGNGNRQQVLHESVAQADMQYDTENASAQENIPISRRFSEAKQPQIKANLRIKVPHRRTPSIDHLRHKAESARRLASPTDDVTSPTDQPPSSSNSPTGSTFPRLSITSMTPTTAINLSPDDVTGPPRSRTPSVRERIQALTSSAAPPAPKVSVPAPTQTRNLTPTFSPSLTPARTPTTPTRTRQSSTASQTAMKRPVQTELYLVKGKRKMYLTRVPIEVETLNHGDVFVLVVPKVDDGEAHSATILVWSGKDAGKVKRAKGKEIGMRMKDKEWGTHAVVSVLEDGVDSPDAEMFWKVLTNGARTTPVDNIKAAEEGGDDVEHEKKIERHMYLYGVNKNTSSVTSITPPGKPLSSKILQKGTTYILDCYTEVYILSGRNASDAERTLALNFTEDLSINQDRPFTATTYFEREGFESVAFRERFYDWPEESGIEVRKLTNVVAKDKTWGVYDRGGVDVKKVEKINVQNMFIPPPPPASWGTPNGQEEEDIGGPPAPEMDRGCLELKVWLAQPHETDSKVEIAPSEHGIFYAEESYLILYRHLTGRDGNEKEAAIAYFWIGSECKSTDQAAAAYLATDLEKQHKARQIRVTQGKEPSHFLGIFKHPVIVRRGTRAEFGTSEKALYHVMGFEKGLVRVIEAVWNPSSLSSANSFVLNLKDKVFIWHGTGSFPFERDMAERVAQRICDSKPITTLEELQEPKVFWQKLGGIDKKSHNHQQDYASMPYLAKKKELEGSYTCRLFRVSHIVHGNPTAEEIDPFVQSDLENTGVYILDAFFEIYIWVGADAKSNYRDVRLALETGLDYADYVSARQQMRNLDRTKVRFVRSGSEPAGFKAAFLAFEDGSEDIAGSTGFLNKLKSKTGRKKREPQEESAIDILEKFNKAVYSFDELKKKDDLPLGVDPAHVEIYLSQPDFQKHFKIDKVTFSSYPAWKQAEMKKRAGLF
ncbi:uncharacterized protein SPPG_04857 [Spizellomyces punctatus DAOM BR117]|uniref:HP domain-containing protein n=1 Tax=Spizellomyces punctatus (strain DAOM BR117) TaxID=645134 RepID=A0A0L0HI88_SPIPD|nr:uncharacterized protein SPPG_04857 [Spizellomyces punctatus DAOM BR117]KND00549.1 hypothetical protein SPPG_04857 [Spizellomyces punctatus DAOM BR117]|eukprot:XP_016608588.1 hypothetical protein SPPG_04857 [Spizellomyces punctatus DAOM BR117]